MLSSVKVSWTRSAARSSASCASTSSFADGLGDGRETYLPPQRDQGEAALLALGDQGGRERRPATAELDEQARDLGVGEADREAGEPFVVVGQRDAGRHHQVAAAQQRPDVGQLGGVHPPDLPVQRTGAGEHHRVGAAHGGHLQHVGDREHADSLTGARPRFMTDRQVRHVPRAPVRMGP